MDFKAVLELIRPVLPPDLPFYLVGGAVRDILTNRPIHDLDFVTPENSLGVARQVANSLGAAYYPLDVERDTGRVILVRAGQPRLVMDFAAMRGPDLESDLRARDFTINAIAIDIYNPDVLIDPLDGGRDLREKRLRPCSPLSFQQDPLRILRAVRLAVLLKYRILPETSEWMRQAVSLLPQVSPERLRDELFRILEGPHPASAMRALDMFGVLSFVLPELLDLKGVQQSAPHTKDVWEHTLDVLVHLEALLDVLDTRYDPDRASSLMMGLAVLRLGRYRDQINAHLEKPFTPDRRLRPLLFLAALYHDIAKPKTFSEEDSGRIHFFQHEEIGADLSAVRARALHLSNPEIDRLKIIVENHLRPHLLAQAPGHPSRRAIYRFFRHCGEAGVDVCLLAMADTLATYGVTLPQDVWSQELEVIRAFLEAWWEKPGESVKPPTLINGSDIINHFHLMPGPEIGRLLEAVREAQAEGKISTFEEALELIRKILA